MKWSSHLIPCSWFFGNKGKLYFALITVVPEYGPLWFLSIPETEENHERTTFCHYWWNKNRNAERAERDTKKWVPEVIPKLEKVLGQVCYIWRGLFWRGQNWCWLIVKYSLRKRQKSRYFNHTLYIYMYISVYVFYEIWTL